jgi:cytochrome subunit of sulfide dehydrogenase
MTNPRVAAALLAVTALPLPASAAVDAARALAAGCLSCHQPGGSAQPSLAGRPRAELIEQLQTFRSGARAGTVMPQIAKGYTDADIEAIAGYFASTPRVP